MILFFIFIFFQIILCVLIILSFKQNEKRYNYLKAFVEDHINDYTNAHTFQNLPKYAPSYSEQFIKENEKAKIYNESKDIDAVMSGKIIEIYD